MYLVDTEHIDTSEVLHRRKILHDHFLPRHVDGSMSQCDGRDHRQKFRSQSNRQGYCEEQRFEWIALDLKTTSIPPSRIRHESFLSENEW